MMKARQIETFMKTIKNETDFKKLKESKPVDAISTAIKLAYNDAKRTMTGIGAFSEKKEQALSNLEALLREYFTKDAPKSRNDFEDTHKKMCCVWTNEFSGDLAKYGKAQKIVNMAFKYLYCCDQKDEKYFTYCHMPLDSYILEWFWRNIGSKSKEIKKSEIPSWSQMDLLQYKTIQDMITKCAADKDTTALELEFVVWPEIQLKLAAEAFLFALDDEMSAKEKSTIKAASITDNWKRIVEELNSPNHTLL